MIEGIQIHFHDHSMMIGHVDTINNYSGAKQSEEKECGEADFEDVIEEGKMPSDMKPSGKMPDELNTPDAIEWLRNIQRRGWLDELFQPVKLTVAQMGCIVVKAQYELELVACWKDFALLWNMNKDTLRMGFVAGQNTKQTKAFNKLLNEI